MSNMIECSKVKTWVICGPRSHSYRNAEMGLKLRSSDSKTRERPELGCRWSSKVPEIHSGRQLSCCWNQSRGGGWAFCGDMCVYLLPSCLLLLIFFFLPRISGFVLQMEMLFLWLTICLEHCQIKSWCLSSRDATTMVAGSLTRYTCLVK